MTSLGQLEAKRTTTNPEMAGLIVRLLQEAGVSPGETVAIGSSGSFPALLIASLAACNAMHVQPVTILSLGSSSYGATRVDFDLLDIYSVVMRSGICNQGPAAASPGGDRDAGLNFDPEFRNRLVDRIIKRCAHLILESNLTRNVAQRMTVYEHASGRRISAFINCGGGYANLGTSELVLRLSPGLNREMQLPPNAQRGIIYEMAAREIPVIHLLYVKGLVQKYGLPWDPVPFPRSGANGHLQPAKLPLKFWILFGVYSGLLVFVYAKK
jgi:poly-gamma-glutamate system protein